MRSKLELIKEIYDETSRQKSLWGEQNHNNSYWLGILMEEVGEVAKEVIELNDNENRTRTELIQSAAVIVSWLECIERKNG